MNHIVTPVVRGVVTAYRYFYSKEHTCQEAEGSWPYLFKDGQPVVCKACEWKHKLPLMQQKVVAARLSMPVLPRDTTKDGFAMIVDITNRVGDLMDSPLLERPVWKGRPRMGGARAAALIANYMAMLGHVVFYVHRSQAINLIYGQRETEAEDVLLYAPVLVFWSNADARGNGNASRIDALIEMRTSGYTFVLGE